MPEPKRDIESLTRRLERLVHILLGRKWKNGGALWQLQIDLLRLQHDIQHAIGTCKNSNQPSDGADTLGQLQELRWHARRFGDAIAWLMLRMNRQFIYPLAENERIPQANSFDHGIRGVLALSEIGAKQGWGFPLLHDITDTLRIGDVTFIKPEGDYATIEVKTRLLNETPTTDGTLDLQYEVTALAPAIDAINQRMRQVSTNTSNQPSNHPRLRVERQLKRMVRARRLQDAPHDSVIEFDGEPPTLSSSVEIPDTGSFAIFASVLRKARRNGYASGSADNAILYSAFYSPNGLLDDTIKDAPLEEDMRASGILFDSESGTNTAHLFSIPARQPAKRACLYMPMYLYSIPRASIIDMINGRLIAIIVVNTGRLVAALESAGFTVQDESGKLNLASGKVRVFRRVNVPELGTFNVELAGLWYYLEEMVYDFHPINFLVEVANKIVQNLTPIAVEKLRKRS